MSSSKAGSVNQKIVLFEGANALSIGGSDPCGGAGIQADLKVFQRLGVYGTTAITLLTIQDTLGVQRVDILDVDFVLDEIDAIMDDVNIRSAKTGALGSAEMVDAVANRVKDFEFPLVVDPVMISKHRHALLDDDAIEIVRSQLLRSAFLVTPNRFEAEKLTGHDLSNPDSVAEAIHDMHLMGAQHVLLKMGQSEGMSLHILGDGQRNVAISLPRLETKNTHGTGCVLSASITARLARGETVDVAVNAAIGEVWQAIHLGPNIGSGFHPIEFQAIGMDTPKPD
jgi:hydroxymethylpyrimidine/phosphomethylpyrimidine kinase